MFGEQLRKLKKYVPGYTPPLTAKQFSQLLDEVNSIRVCLGIGEGKLQELPAGNVSDGSRCVLARALSDKWRAAVSADEITLFWEGSRLGEVNWKKVCDSLRRRGFKYVEAYNANDCSLSEWLELYPDEGFFGDLVRFNATDLMHRFVNLYDDGEFPWLILGHENDWESEVKFRGRLPILRRNRSGVYTW